MCFGLGRRVWGLGLRALDVGVLVFGFRRLWNSGFKA